MAEMGLTPTDRWHLLGKHACHHVEGADFVTTRDFDELALTHPEWGSVGVPSDLGGLDARWCRHCERTLDDMKSSRFSAIVELKGLVPYRDVSWRTVDCAGDCPWCGKADSATEYDDDLDVTVCPACAGQYDNPWTEVEDPPETDRRLEKPTDAVDPVRYTYYTGNAERPPDDPSPSESRKRVRQRAADERRPYVEVKVKGKYADVVCDVAGTGHRVTPAAIEEIEALQREEKEKTDADPDHIRQDRRRFTRDLRPDDNALPGGRAPARRRPRGDRSRSGELAVTSSVSRDRPVRPGRSAGVLG